MVFCIVYLSSTNRDAAETIASLQAFRKRHSEAQRLQNHYATQPTTVDIAHYRSVLRNKGIVDEAEKLLREFKPVTYDVNAHVKAIEAFEAKAVGFLGPVLCIMAKICLIGRQSQGDRAEDRC